jgi:HSP20 family protein
MKLVKRSNYQPAFNSFFDDFFTKDVFGQHGEFPFKGTAPSVNIINNDDAFVIEVAAPGMKKEDFNLELDNNLLSISYEKKEEKEETGKYTRREFSYESFKRSFTIPENVVNGEAIQAKYEDGILRLNLPKKEEAKVQPKRAIEIG